MWTFVLHVETLAIFQTFNYDNNGDDLHIQEESASPDIAGYQAVDTIYPLLVEEDADQDADTGTVLANSTV